jgi:SAM-dependent methyltransferase
MKGQSQGRRLADAGRECFDNEAFRVASRSGTSLAFGEVERGPMQDVQRLRDLFDVDDRIVSALPDDVGGEAPSKERIAAWTRLIGGYEQFGIEYLLPRLRQKITAEWPAWTRRRPSDGSLADLRERVEAMRPWLMTFPFGDGIVPVPDPEVARVSADAIRYRRDLVCEPILALLGSDAVDTTVLDIGCNCGFFSLDLADRGVGHVRGIDLRRHSIRQANFLAELCGVPNVEFAARDVDSLDSADQCDVVLNLGVLYHVVNPLQFVRQTYELCRRFAVIDTVVHREPVPAYFLVGERDSNWHFGEGRESYELHPSYRAVIDTLRYAGFRDVVEVVGDAERQHPLYARGSRRCFIAMK